MTDKSDLPLWQQFDIKKMIAEMPDKPAHYREFLRVPALSFGLLRLEAGAKDMQGPHNEDEVYYVLSGRARLRIGEDIRPVGPGSILYVGATEEHSFFEIDEDMTLLVFFSAAQ